MNNPQRRDAQLPYISDEEVMEEQRRTRAILQKLNTIDVSDFEGIAALVRELLQTREDPFINPPFYCDYGTHIKVGKHFFANYNCTFLDVAPITFGDNCLLGPNVSIYTAGHPVHPDSRRSRYEYGIAVTIGNDVWLGGSTVVCPGVTIGDGCVIGAGSVVTRDIPPYSIAAGNPCRVIRPITDEDRKYYFRDRVFDDEAWSAIQREE
ncbi:MAG: sugar O-acetyltransferase [Candidatus Faecousia sp.]|nr:sugar O-acetyltransferase [Clostridiales bacterium]MDY6181412.1 sugar O-acetyltransferase [Candidatus Faecousia sp.]